MVIVVVLLVVLHCQSCAAVAQQDICHHKSSAQTEGPSSLAADILCIQYS